MSVEWIALAVAVASAWFGMGVLAAGWNLACFQREYPAIARACFDEDLRAARSLIVLGPLALFAELASYGDRHGWMNPLTAKRPE